MGLRHWIHYAAACVALVAAQTCEQLVCATDYSPVCGTDGRLYSNRCQLTVASCKCSYCIKLLPSCSTDCAGRNSRTSCANVESSQCKLTTCLDFLGDTEASAASVSTTCVTPCDSVLRPVCGSDGRTYDNECQFEIARCLSGDKLTLTRNAACPTSSTTTSPTLKATTLSTQRCARRCKMTYSPVCGSDGNTYANECVLSVAICQSGNKLSQVSATKCEPATPTPSALSVNVSGQVYPKTSCVRSCSMDQKFVCGSNGMTYYNPCFFEISKCQSGGAFIKAADGLCPVTTVPTPTSTAVLTSTAKPQQCDIVCSMQYTPVCGSDGVTYGNACLLSLAACEKGYKISSAKSGECEDSLVAIAMVPNVAGDVVTTLTAEQTEEASDCQRPCKALYSPVCGSDGRTYANPCAFEIASCVWGERLTEVVQGPCVATAGSDFIAMGNGTDVDTCARQCPMEEVLVCGSDGRTYDNECMLNVWACRLDGNLTKVSDGACPSTDQTSTASCTRVCPKERQPVCGSNKLTYANQCVLENAACQSGGKVTMVSEGQCDSSDSSAVAGTILAAGSAEGECEETCALEASPVCGSDGVTYSNVCELELAACKAKKVILKASDGECVSTVALTSALTASPPPYSRCGVATHCSNVLGGEEAEWTCTDHMVCRPAQCDLSAKWLVVSCGPSECAGTDPTLDNLGYCRPKDL